MARDLSAVRQESNNLDNSVVVQEQEYTIMAFSAGVHDVICTRKINIDRGGSRGQYCFFWCISHHVHKLKSKRKAMNRNWSNQKENPALNTKAGNK